MEIYAVPGIHRKHFLSTKDEAESDFMELALGERARQENQSFPQKVTSTCRSQARGARGMQGRANISDRGAGKGFSEKLTAKLSVAELNHLRL